MNQCTHCQATTPNPKFCSRSCAASFTNRTPKRKLTRQCANCTATVRNYRSSLCEACFQTSRDRYRETLHQLTLADYFTRPSITNLHASSKYAHVRGFARTWNRALTELPCAACGYAKHVELCHIRSLVSFPPTATLGEVNNRQNLVQLCPNCHWEFDHGLLTVGFPDQPESQQ